MLCAYQLVVHAVCKSGNCTLHRPAVVRDVSCENNGKLCVSIRTGISHMAQYKVLSKQYTLYVYCILHCVHVPLFVALSGQGMCRRSVLK